MRVSENKTIFHCGFCKKYLLKKDAMERHEKWCGGNPENHKACVGCKHLEEREIDICVE